MRLVLGFALALALGPARALAGVPTAAAPPKPPHGATRLAIDYDYASFHHDEHHYVLEWKDGAYHVDKAVMDATLVEQLYAALGHTQDRDRVLRCMSHTDDYPHITIVVDGSEPVRVESDSNCHAHVPWNLTVKDRQLVQWTGEADRAVAALLVAIDPVHWKVPTVPDATTMFPAEVVDLGDYGEPRQPASTAAAACAQGFEQDLGIAKVLGAHPLVGRLQLTCDLSDSPDCTATNAQLSFGWAGLTAHVGVACRNGTIDLTGRAAKLAEVRRFVDSKPVRAVVKLGGGISLWDNGRWQVEGGGDLPRLDWALGSSTIDARIVGERGKLPGARFWTELRIDPKQLTRHDDGLLEITARLDFDGKLAK